LGKPVFKQAQYYIDRQQTDTANLLAGKDIPAPKVGACPARSIWNAHEHETESEARLQ
jgi:hypothetical protein